MRGYVNTPPRVWRVRITRLVLADVVGRKEVRFPSRRSLRSVVSCWTNMSMAKSCRVALTLKEKVDIIEQHGAGKSVADIARERRRPKTTVYTLLKSKEQILSTWRTGERSSSSRRVTRSTWPQLDSALFEGVSNAMAAGLDISNLFFLQGGRPTSSSQVSSM